ncbi:MAG: LacI family DNA-binding transcriptional regulator [Selenomonas sp.]|nr:LacI family DNA-binding transcriptional regulator [Selenomonas sp.]
MMGKKNATIVDVAKEAGVSVATVSRVVNGNYPVKPETKVAVSAAIEKLHYVPNVQARELNQRRSTTIGVVVPSLYNMFFAEVIDGIEATVRKDKYSLLLNCAQDDPEQEQACIRALVARNVAGLIVISPNTSNMQEDFYQRLAERTPLVFINGYHQIEGASYVSNDEAGGMRTALTSLRKLGHERILLVRGSHSDSYEVKEKVYRNFMEEQGCLDENLILDIGAGNSVDTVDNTADYLLARLPEVRPTAVCCCNDLMAVGALNACKALELSVPEDISIMGFDNISLSRYVAPKLTTMDQNMFQLGESAAALVVEKIRYGRSKKIVLGNMLIQRESVAEAKK